MPAHFYADDPLTGRSRPLDDAIATAQLIDQLPRTMAALPLFALTLGDVGQPWRVTVTLTPADQAAVDTLQPSVAQLCAAAQHALGLAAIGSIIEPACGTIKVRVADEMQLRFIGASALWWVANAPPPLLRTFLDHLAAEVGQHRRG
jgi:hypothetical protein